MAAEPGSFRIEVSDATSQVLHCCLSLHVTRLVIRWTSQIVLQTASWVPTYQNIVCIVFAGACQVDHAAVWADTKPRRARGAAGRVFSPSCRASLCSRAALQGMRLQGKRLPTIRQVFYDLRQIPANVLSVSSRSTAPTGTTRMYLLRRAPARVARVTSSRAALALR